MYIYLPNKQNLFGLRHRNETQAEHRDLEREGVLPIILGVRAIDALDEELLMHVENLGVAHPRLQLLEQDGVAHLHDVTVCTVEEEVAALHLRVEVV